MSKNKVLVVDDDRNTLNYVSGVLTARGLGVDCLDRSDQVIPRLQGANRPSLMILDIVMPEFDGLEVLAAMENMANRVPTIVVSAAGQVPTVVKAMRLGAADYLLKPFSDEDLSLAVDGVLDSLPNGDVISLADDTHVADVASSNPQMLRIKDIARRVADTDVPVLILGESGVGKEVLAKYIYAYSPRRSQPFIKVNCAALPADLLESEFFGYERGAFTGALHEKKGKFELADKGTLMLDEIGDMSPSLQAKLLHVLQDGEFSRLGGTRTLRVDTRVIASTNKALENAVAKGEFREDLYYRLNVIKIQIPPLRERPEDIPVLSRHLFERYRVTYHRPGVQLPDQLLDAFRRYSWPGNVRQLENVIKRFVVLPDVDLILSDLREPLPAAAPPAAEVPVSLKALSSIAAEQAEKEAILKALAAHNWNRKQVAKELNICYKSLLNKLRKWQISGRSRSSAPQSSAVDPNENGIL